MAIASYTTDLTVFKDFESASTVSTEFSGYTATAKGEDQDSDFPIQGSQHASAEQRTTGNGSLVVDYGSNVTWTSDDNFFMWGIFLAPAAVNSDANAGIEMCVGASSTAFYRWTVGGNDFGTYPYGGWQNFVVNPEVTIGRTTTGSPGTSYRWVGMLCNVISAITKGSPYGIDVIRYGRGELVVTNGQSGSYGTFAGMATANDANTAKWGLFQDIDGSYLWKGLISLGSSSTSVDFRDANREIIVDNTRRVNADFNKIEINNTGSNIEWENISIKARGTVSPGDFEMVANATFDDVGGVFTDMGTFIYDSNYTATSRTWRRCEQVTQGGGTFTSCLFEESTSAVALVVDDLSIVTDCTFTSSGAGHAVNLGNVTSTTSMTWNNFESGYALQTGTAANRTVLVNVSSGQTLTINVAAGASSPTYYNTGTGTVNVVAGQVTLTIKVQDITTTSVIENARVYVTAAAGGDMTEGTVIIDRVLTDSNGEVSDTRGYTADQPITGWARSASVAPYYKTSYIAGTVSNVSGLNITLQMIRDQ